MAMTFRGGCTRTVRTARGVLAAGTKPVLTKNSPIYSMPGRVSEESIPSRSTSLSLKCQRPTEALLHAPPSNRVRRSVSDSLFMMWRQSGSEVPRYRQLLQHPCRQHLHRQTSLLSATAYRQPQP